MRLGILGVNHDDRVGVQQGSCLQILVARISLPRVIVLQATSQFVPLAATAGLN